MHVLFFDNININDSNPKNIKVDESSYRHVLIYCIRYGPLDGQKPLYIHLKKINGYIEVKNGSQYLTLISVDENKGEIKTYKETWWLRQIKW